MCQPWTHDTEKNLRRQIQYVHYACNTYRKVHSEIQPSQPTYKLYLKKLFRSKLVDPRKTYVDTGILDKIKHENLVYKNCMILFHVVDNFPLNVSMCIYYLKNKKVFVEWGWPSLLAV